MAKGVDFDVGSQSAGPAGVESSSTRVLILKDGGLPPSLGAVFAVVDADEATSGELNHTLSDAFRPGGDVERVTPGEEQGFLLHLLRDMRSSHPLASVAVAVQVNSDVVLGASGGATAGVFGSPPGTLTLIGKQTAEADPVVDRANIHSDGFLVLGGRAIAARVDEVEIRQTVQGSMSVNDAAAWLAMLGAGRGGVETTAIVARTQGGRSKGGMAAEGRGSDKPGNGSGLPLSPLARVGVGAAIVLIAVLVVGGILVLSKSSVNAPAAPTSLKSSTVKPPSTVTLSWTGTAGSDGYRVSIAGQHYSAKTTSVTVSGLPPGKSYSWRVYALYGANPGPASRTATLVIPAATATTKPTVVSPAGTVAAASSGTSTPVSFCWTFPLTNATYALRVGGGGHRYNHWALKNSVLTKSASGASCYSLSLPSGTAYSWRLGAKVPGYYASWTTWHHFRISEGAGPTSTPVPHPFPRRRHRCQPRLDSRRRDALMARAHALLCRYYISSDVWPAAKPAAGSSGRLRFLK